VAIPTRKPEGTVMVWSILKYPEMMEAEMKYEEKGKEEQVSKAQT